MENFPYILKSNTILNSNNLIRNYKINSMKTTHVEEQLYNGDINCFKVTEMVEKCLKTEKATSYNKLMKNSNTLQKRTLE
jgi:hypothetical protein